MFRLFVFLIVCLPTFAQAQCNGVGFWPSLTDMQQAELIQRSADTPFGTGNFWQATRGDATLSIVGTLHLPDPRHDLIMDKIGPRLAATDLLLVEATLDDQSAMQTHIARNPDLMTLTHGTTLPERLDPDVWAAIRDAAAARGVPGFMAAKMQPWFLSLTLSMPACALSAMASGDVGLDALLMRRAAEQGTPVAALEPWHDMFDFCHRARLMNKLRPFRLG